MVSTKAIDLKNAKDVSVFDDATANAVVPHVGRLFIEGQPIESIEFHSERMWWFNVSYPYAMASPKVSIEGTFTCILWS